MAALVDGSETITCYFGFMVIVTTVRERLYLDGVDVDIGSIHLSRIYTSSTAMPRPLCPLYPYPQQQ